MDSPIRERASARSEHVTEQGTWRARAWGLVQGHPALTIGCFALLLRLAILVIVNLFFDGRFAGDDASYSTLASAASDGNRFGWLAQDFELYRSTYAFTGPITLIYAIFGPIKWIAQVYVAVLGSLVALLATKLASGFMRPAFALIAGAIPAFLPSQVLWSSLLLKDASVWLALVGLALAVVLAGHSRGWTLVASIATWVALLVMLAFLREHTMVIAAWMLVPAAWFGSKETLWLRLAAAVLLAVTVPAAVGSGPGGWYLISDGPALAQRRLANAAGARSAFLEEHQQDAVEHQQELNAEIDRTGSKIEELKSRSAELESKAAEMKRNKRAARLLARAATLKARALQMQRTLERNQAQLAEIVDSAEPTGLAPNISHLPKGLSVMLFEPFPWSIGSSLSYDLARFEAIAWYPILMLALIGLVAARKHLTHMSFPILAAAAIIVVYALSEGNVGTAFRHRGETVWAVGLLAALGLQRLWDGRSARQDSIGAVL